MHITGIGINADAARLNGSLAQLEEDLSFFHRCGFDAVEISIHGLDVVINGGLYRPRVNRVRAATERFDFVYTVHAPDRLNLAFPHKRVGNATGLAFEQDVFVACLDFCAAIGAGVMVYHSGLIALHEAAIEPGTLPDDDRLEQAREQEESALRQLTPLAAERGVVVAMENRNPHLWELVTLQRAGLATDQLLKYHPGLAIPNLVRQVEAVGHPNLGLTLDFAHLLLAANQCGFDYLEAIRQAAPKVRHLHGNDNFGQLDSIYSDLPDSIPYGDGDLHLPPGWGVIPHLKAMAQLPAYEGLYILELRPRFYEHFPEALETIWRIVEEVINP